jgi:hypothetical protein
MRWGSRGAPLDETEPVVGNVTLAEASELESDSVIGFDVTDDGTLALSFVWVRLPSGDTEVVHDGAAFTDRYGAESTREAIAGGWRFRVRRVGGWPLTQGGTLSIRIAASDAGGNVV